MNVEATLFCGQSFSWTKIQEETYLGVVGDRAVQVRQKGDNLVIERVDDQPLTQEDEAFWRVYFALDIDYISLQNKFKNDDKLKPCVEFGQGIRVLRQPFFETLLSFILSQNNHIPRIAGIVERLRAQFGPRITDTIYGFPKPEQLACLEVEDLAPLRAGFRARYVLDAAKKVASGEIEEEKLSSLPDGEARKLLMTICGVGPKVADCVLLYALGRYRVVPMDVWMKRAMAQLFPNGMPPCAEGYEGIAQQFIFHWARTQKTMKNH